MRELCLRRRRGWAAGAATILALLLAGAPAGGHDGGTPPGTTITVSPNSDLAASQSVSVNGSGFGPGGSVDVSQCTAEALPRCTPLGNTTANPSSGAFTTTVTVMRVFTADDASTVDCREADCIVYATLSSSGTKFAHAHIAFRMPIATSSPAANVTSVAVRLTGAINPKGGATNGFAEYSTSPTLAASSATAPVAMGSGTADVPFAADVSGLAPATTYYYRVVATWPDGTTVRGAILSFTTAPVSGPGGPGGGGPSDTVAPVITRATVSPTSWRIRFGGPSEAAVSIARGSVFAFTLSEPARVVFTVERIRPGRRVGRLCRPPTRENRHRALCNRYVRKGRFAYAGQAGHNRKTFSGRIARRALAPGRYRTRLVAADAAGNASKPASVRFAVIAG